MSKSVFLYQIPHHKIVLELEEYLINEKLISMIRKLQNSTEIVNSRVPLFRISLTTFSAYFGIVKRYSC